MSKIIIYDFDGTLTPFPIPKFDFLEACGFKDGLRNKELNIKVNNRSVEKNISKFQALYEEVLACLKENNYELNDETFSIGCKDVIYNEGVEEFLEYLNNNNVDNYLLSSGIKVFLEHTSVGKYFKEIYATTFKYENGQLIDVDYLMSPRNKVDAIKDIMKKNGMRDCSDIIYIGDGMTDFHAMEFVINNNGTSIFVYGDNSKDGLEQINDVVSFRTRADYRLDKELFKYIKEKCNL